MPSPQGPNSASAVRVTWRNSAACLDEDPDLSSLSGSRAPRCTAQMTPRPSAVSVRSLRPAGSALWSGQKTSVFGGLSKDERRTLKRRNARSRRAGWNALRRTPQIVSSITLVLAPSEPVPAAMTRLQRAGRAARTVAANPRTTVGYPTSFQCV